MLIHLSNDAQYPLRVHVVDDVYVARQQLQYAVVVAGNERRKILNTNFVTWAAQVGSFSRSPRERVASSPSTGLL